MQTKKVLFVVTSHDQLGDTEKKTGLWLGELAAPYYALADRGHAITIASPKGGRAPIDPFSEAPQFATDATRRFHDDRALATALEATTPLRDVTEDGFDAVFYPGGHGPMWDLAEDLVSARLIESFYAKNKPIAFLCHGSVALKKVAGSDGRPLVRGRRVSGFTNGEEAAVELTEVVPFLTEDMLKGLGADYRKGDDWTPFAVVDGSIITGQNPQSAELVAEKLLAALGDGRGR